MGWERNEFDTYANLKGARERRVEVLWTNYRADMQEALV